MSETRDDLREALVSHYLTAWNNTELMAAARADSLLSPGGPLAPIIAELGSLRAIVAADDAAAVAEYEWERANGLVAERDAALAQVSVLQAEVERLKAERKLTDRRIRGQRAALRDNWRIIDERVGVASRHRLYKIAQNRGVALREALAEVERLQKVEGERGRLERDPSGPCWSDKPEPQSVSALRATITSRDDLPFYKRTLDSFADEIITRVEPGHNRVGGEDRPNGLWYAVLDVGPKPCVSDPDFSTCARSREDAVRLCAQKIRNDAQGIGRFAPHSLLIPGCYDLCFRLMKYWSEKEGAAPCDRSGEAGETSGLDPQGESTVTGAARQAPSNPITENEGR